jgi:hypothetical protein
VKGETKKFILIYLLNYQQQQKITTIPVYKYNKSNIFKISASVSKLLFHGWQYCDGSFRRSPSRYLKCEQPVKERLLL